MKKLLAVALLAFSSAFASAAPVVGSVYLDSANLEWTYVGSFKVTDGAAWSTGGITYNGIEAATKVFGNLSAGSFYATSTADTTVDHLAWYDGYGQIQHLKHARNVGLAEDLNEDQDAPGYGFASNGQGDWSAYIRDHVTDAQASVNYVFERNVPEPASLALALLGFAALGAARRKKA
jgi:hypothetical protein